MPPNNQMNNAESFITKAVSRIGTMRFAIALLFVVASLASSVWYVAMSFGNGALCGLYGSRLFITLPHNYINSTQSLPYGLHYASNHHSIALVPTFVSTASYWSASFPTWWIVLLAVLPVRFSRRNKLSGQHKPYANADSVSLQTIRSMWRRSGMILSVYIVIAMCAVTSAMVVVSHEIAGVYKLSATRQPHCTLSSTDSPEIVDGNVMYFTLYVTESWDSLTKISYRRRVAMQGTLRVDDNVYPIESVWNCFYIDAKHESKMPFHIVKLLESKKLQYSYVDYRGLIRTVGAVAAVAFGSLALLSCVQMCIVGILFRRVRRDLCPRCKYAIAGMECCPECGQVTQDFVGELKVGWININPVLATVRKIV